MSASGPANTNNGGLESKTKDQSNIMHCCAAWQTSAILLAGQSTAHGWPFGLRCPLATALQLNIIGSTSFIRFTARISCGDGQHEATPSGPLQQGGKIPVVSRCSSSESSSATLQKRVLCSGGSFTWQCLASAHTTLVTAREHDNVHFASSTVA